MKKYLTALLLSVSGMAIAIPHASAEAASPTAKKSGETPAKKASKKSTSAGSKNATGSDDEESEPDITGTNSVDFQCELGNKLTIYEHAADNAHIALRWKKRIHRLRRVHTTTGAHRYENRRYGLVWIGIPAKGMLLDSKKGQQLANECKNAEQAGQNAVAVAADAPMHRRAAPDAPAEAGTHGAPATPGAPPDRAQSGK